MKERRIKQTDKVLGVDEIPNHIQRKKRIWWQNSWVWMKREHNKCWCWWVLAVERE